MTDAPDRLTRADAMLSEALYDMEALVASASQDDIANILTRLIEARRQLARISRAAVDRL